jgi:cytoskeletal protein CcmA (bactofilin family)
VTSGTVIVHGVLEGDISAGNLVVQETGTIKGRIKVAQNAEIFGKVFERLNVKGLLHLRSSCRVEGHISCGALQIEQGASITGGLYPNDYRADQQNFNLAGKDGSPLAAGTSRLQQLDASARMNLAETQAFSNSRSL